MPDRFTCINYISRNFYFLILKSSKSNESSDIEVNELKSKNLLVLNFSKIEKLDLNFICRVEKMFVNAGAILFGLTGEEQTLCLCDKWPM